MTVPWMRFLILVFSFGIVCQLANQLYETTAQSQESSHPILTRDRSHVPSDRLFADEPTR
jgi:hypothetical protein